MNLVLIASHSNQVFLIDLNSGRLVSQIPSVPYISQILLQEQQLYIGGRAGQHIEVWDIKFAKAATQTASIPRFHPTHQKILFDVDSCFNLAIGHADGTISVLNRDFSIVNSFDAHFDAVNSVQFFCNGIVSSSGQRSIFPRESYSLIREFDFIIN
jgi:WD40 repeat protein